MRAVSDEKHGVASAVNDTTREVGGALFIAIAGSILASGYTSRISPVERRQKLKAAGPPSGQPVPRLHQRAAALCGLTTALVRPGSHSVISASSMSL